jgi:hypothetical protein
VSVDFGELTGVIGDIDIGAHIVSMHPFYFTCKIYQHMPDKVYCTQDSLRMNLEMRIHIVSTRMGRVSSPTPGTTS